MKIRLKQIEKRIDRIRSELIKIDAMRPGSLTRQYKDPKKQTGAYYQLSYTLDMRAGLSTFAKNGSARFGVRSSSTSVTNNSTLSGYL